MYVRSLFFLFKISFSLCRISRLSIARASSLSSSAMLAVTGVLCFTGCIHIGVHMQSLYIGVCSSYFTRRDLENVTCSWLHPERQRIYHSKWRTVCFYTISGDLSEIEGCQTKSGFAIFFPCHDVEAMRCIFSFWRRARDSRLTVVRSLVQAKRLLCARGMPMAGLVIGVNS